MRTILLFLIAAVIGPSSLARGAEEKLRAYVGTYTGPKAKGI
jgi:hypothetical protein